MAIKLMYVTNRVDVALIAENSGVDRIFVDMEYIGKDIRQGGMDTLQSKHTLNDVYNIRNAISKSELIVRCNPIHSSTDAYTSSEDEINGIVMRGADIVMLPYFKTTEEVKKFLDIVSGRSKTMLLFETPESVERIDEILSIPGIDMVHIGINDLSLGYGKKFMFQLLADGTVENICKVFKSKNYRYGFGGIIGVGKGALPAEKIIAEHYRLGSEFAILSRSFCKPECCKDIEEIREVFETGIPGIRNFENECICGNIDYEKNRLDVVNVVNDIINKN